MASLLGGQTFIALTDASFFSAKQKDALLGMRSIASLLFCGVSVGDDGGEKDDFIFLIICFRLPGTQAQVCSHCAWNFSHVSPSVTSLISLSGALLNSQK